MSKKTKFITAILLLVLTIFSGVSLAGWYFINRRMQPGNENAQSKTPSRLNILLLGSDARPGEKIGNTDTIIVAQIDRDRLSLLSIPRDTRVEIPGYGINKINAACRYGGPELTAKVVSDLIGIPVEKYALIRWSGFIKIVDTLGGVDIYIPRNMHYDPQEGPEYRIDLHKGYQHLDGREALAFVRFRMEALGDIDRTKQQLQFLKALADKVKQPTTLVRLPVLLPELYKNVDTNMTMGEVLTAARAGYNLKEMAVVTQTLPGYFLTIDGVSYWGVDPEQARQVALDLFEYGLTTDRVVLETPSYLLSKENQAVRIAQKPSDTELQTEPMKEVQIEIGSGGNQEQTGSGTDTGSSTVDNSQTGPGSPQVPEGTGENPEAAPSLPQNENNQPVQQQQRVNSPFILQN